VDVGPVVVRRDERASFDRLQFIPVEMADGWFEGALDGPGDLAALLEGGDDDGDVVLAQRVVLERLPVHVDHERVTHGGDGISRGGHKHPRGVDRDMALRVCE
jgi:hypothetical protein